VTRPGSDDVHLLDADERAQLFGVERRAIIKAGVIGAASAGICAAVEVALIPREADLVFYWGVLGAVSAVCSVLEIVLLSVDALHAAHGQAVIAGVQVSDDVARERTFRVLARAALELPNPIDEVVVDPLKETPKAWLLLAALAYKAKVSLTNVIVKQLVRRALGRATLRAAVVPFVAVPVTALWNVAVARRVLRESRVRVLGPSAAVDVVRRTLPAGLTLSPNEAEAAMRAVGAAIVRSADLHPNHVELLRVIRARLDVDLPKELDSSSRFLATLATIGDEKKQLVRTLLRAAVILDGRVPRRERQLLRAAGAEEGVDDALRAFALGLPIPTGAAMMRRAISVDAFVDQRR
jgi:hypothetical protein